jgi:hypothetical protein
MRITVCHCRFCQRNTGTTYLVEPVFAKTEFEITSGTPRAYDVVSEGSGKRVTIHFCGTCGARVFLTFERVAGHVGTFGGSFDDPNSLGLTSDIVRQRDTDRADGRKGLWISSSNELKSCKPRNRTRFQGEAGDVAL